MGDYANTFCERCGKPFNNMRERAGGIYYSTGPYCDECKSYRQEKIFEAKDLARDSIRNSVEYTACPLCGGRGKLSGGGVSMKCARCTGSGDISGEIADSLSAPRNIGSFEFLNLNSFDGKMRDEIKKRLPSDYDKKDNCIITTACVEARDLPDNCLELQVLRGFRDGFVLNNETGRNEMREYCAIAPGIVSSIKSKPNSQEIFEDIYDRMVRKAVKLIIGKQFGQAYEHYKNSVLELKERFTS